jgi:acetyl-CoA synthetase
VSDYVWEPTPEYIERANVTRLMRKLGITDYWELVERSQRDVEWFWEAAIEDVGIDFLHPYDRLLDASKGPQWPLWFLGGKINLTHNCVDRHATGDLAGEPAIIW